MTPAGTHPRELLEAALEGRLALDDRRRFSAHLKTCRACAAEFRLAHTLGSLAVTGAIRGREPLTAAEAARLEARVLAAAGIRRPVGLEFDVERRWWKVPAAVLVGATAGLLLWMAVHPGAPGDTPSEPATAVSRPGPLDRMAPGRIAENRPPELPAQLGATLPAGTGVHAILLDDFERVTDLGRLSLAGAGNLRLARGGVSGQRCFSPGPAGDPGAPLEVEIAIPPATRARTTGVSVWVRAMGGEVEIAAVAGFADGRTADAGVARRVAPAGWTQVLFPVPGDAGARPADPAWIRFRMTGRGSVELDRVEAWVTNMERRP